MCDFHSLSYSCISWSCLLALFLWNLRTDISNPFEDYRAKGNIPRSKWERSFLRNFFVICEFISQSYSFPLKKLFSMTLLVKFAKWYLQTNIGLWWKRKYLQLKTEKKHSEKLLCVLIIHLTELLPYPSRSLSLRLYLWNMQRDTCKPIEGNGEEGNIFR